MAQERPGLQSRLKAFDSCLHSLELRFEEGNRHVISPWITISPNMQYRVSYENVNPEIIGAKLTIMTSMQEHALYISVPSPEPNNQWVEIVYQNISSPNTSRSAARIGNNENGDTTFCSDTGQIQVILHPDDHKTVSLGETEDYLSIKIGTAKDALEDIANGGIGGVLVGAAFPGAESPDLQSLIETDISKAWELVINC